MEQNENTLSVLKIAPGQYPQQVEIDNDLKALQQAVGGSIGASYPFEDTLRMSRRSASATASIMWWMASTPSKRASFVTAAEPCRFSARSTPV